MVRVRRILSRVWLGLFVPALVGCAILDPTNGPIDPDDRLMVQVSPRPAPNPRGVSEPLRDPPLASPEELARRYTQFEARLIGEGKLREDRGALTDLTHADLAMNFIRIALYDEYSPVDGRLVARESSSLLRRWHKPVKLALHFGGSVPPERRDADQVVVEELIEELHAATDHPIELVQERENFSVFVVDETERLRLRPVLQELIPGISPSVTASILDILPSTFCLVVAFSAQEAPQTYMRAVAIIRAEHPPVLRRACFHEEIAQGLGLANDSPQARPSIFNDDEEFALLTVQDRLLLQMLYDARLRPGMAVSEAEPVVAAMAQDLLPPQNVAALTSDPVSEPKPAPPRPEQPPEGSGTQPGAPETATTPAAPE